MDESDEGERKNHVEFAGLFPEDMTIDDYAIIGDQSMAVLVKHNFCFFFLFFFLFEIF